MATDQANVALARRWFEEVWNQRRTETVHELVPPESVCHTDLGEMVGPQPFLAFHAQLLQALPDLKIVVEEAVGDGNSVAVRWLASGTHTGVFQGKPPTGTLVRFGGTTWIHYRDAKMVEGWDCWNITGLAQQLMGRAT